MGYNNDVTDIEPFSKSEYRAAQRQLDHFYRGRKKLHLHECQSVRHPMAEVTETATDTVPYGYCAVCQFCRKWWRDEKVAPGT